VLLHTQLITFVQKRYIIYSSLLKDNTNTRERNGYMYVSRLRMFSSISGISLFYTRCG